MGLGHIYYGWIVVAALCVTETVTWGVVYYDLRLAPLRRDGASLLLLGLGSYERLFRLLTAVLLLVSAGVFAVGTDVARNAGREAPSMTDPPPTSPR